jgi:hypothetical protein
MEGTASRGNRAGPPILAGAAPAILYGLPRTAAPHASMTKFLMSIRRTPWLAWSLLMLGTAGFAALWVLLALYSQRQVSWMAVVGAVDAAWLLRLGRWPRGTGRALAAVAATLAIVALANWWIIATHLSGMLGLSAWDTAARLGWNHAWTLAGLANGVADLAWIAAAVVVAAAASR